MSATERDFEVLSELVSAYDQKYRVHAKHYGPDHMERLGVSPLECGGTNGSDHSYRLTKLAKLGLAQHRKAGYGWDWHPTRNYRGSKQYRPTQAGRDALDAYFVTPPADQPGEQERNDACPREEKLVEVRQCDREAAAEFASFTKARRSLEEAIMIGALDGNYIVQAFARHRQAAEAEAIERAAGAIRRTVLDETRGLRATDYRKGMVWLADRAIDSIRSLSAGRGS